MDTCLCEHIHSIKATLCEHNHSIITIVIKTNNFGNISDAVKIKECLHKVWYHDREMSVYPAYACRGKWCTLGHAGTTMV